MYNFIKISVYVHFSAGEGGTGNAKLLQDSRREDWSAVASNVFECRDKESLFVACPAGAELLRRLHQLRIEFRHEVLQRRPLAVDGDPDAPEKEQQTGRSASAMRQPSRAAMASSKPISVSQRIKSTSASTKALACSV